MRVLVAMSGGVDSSVAALVLQEQGHEVTGVTLRLWGGASDKGCCSVADVEDARRVAGQLGIDHHVFNMADEFNRLVVDPYVAAHQAGSTPNPCIECNRHLKFDLLLESARRLGFERVASGHHAKVKVTDHGVDLRRGHDLAKDQSYVLSMLGPDQLAMLLLPVGEMTKSEVRELARSRGLVTSAKAESQDTCFIESSGGRRRFLGDRISLHRGTLIDLGTNEEVGHVDELELVTVGQRRGLGVDDSGQRRVAVEIDVARRAVLVADPASSLIDAVALDPSSITWTAAPLSAGTPVVVQLRSHAAAIPAIWRGDHLALGAPSSPVAPGQTAAMYRADDPEVVLGSGVVIR